MAATSLPDCENLPPDERYVYEALAKFGYGEFSALPVPEMQAVLALALYLKRKSEHADEWES